MQIPEDIKQLIILSLTIMFFPAALFWFKRFITKRDKEVMKIRKAEEAELSAKLDVMNTKLDNSEQNMLEFRNDVRKDITAIHDRIGDFKATNDSAHGELWKENNFLRERVKGLETAHNILHPECQINTREAQNG